ncbi:hypothetical protein G9A89_022522 [Geosiphon pyriformis]|nr:hypothetical protein G9A89_022522 [Geosiphon pyriformis]
MTIQSDKASGTMNHVSFVENSCLTKECGMTFLVKEEHENGPISSCTSELELTLNLNSNSNNDDDENNSSSFAQYGNKNNNDSDTNSNPEICIALLDLIKKQKLKWFSNNNEGIMSEHMHNTNTEFDLRYPEKNLIKLEPHLCTYIDLKIALEILATTMV